MKEEIKKWIHSDRDFDAGIALLYKYKRNKSLISNIEGNPKKYAGKLLWELAKLAGYSLPDMELLRAGKIPKSEQIPDKPIQKYEEPIQKPQKPVRKKPAKKKMNLPEDVVELIKATKAVYNERALLHKELGEIPDENTPENIKRRTELHELITECTEKFEVLSKAKEDYFELDIMPNLDELSAILTPVKIEVNKNDGAALMKRKKNLESSISKDRNILLYQDKKKHDEENPLPEGEYRTKVENRIKDKMKELEEINELLNADKKT